MGLFDYVEVLCPCCDGPVLFQSKAALFPHEATYCFAKLSDTMRASLIGQRAECPKCKATVDIKGEVTVKAWPEATG